MIQKNIIKILILFMCSTLLAIYGQIIAIQKYSTYAMSSTRNMYQWNSPAWLREEVNTIQPTIISLTVDPTEAIYSSPTMTLENPPSLPATSIDSTLLPTMDETPQPELSDQATQIVPTETVTIVSLAISEIPTSTSSAEKQLLYIKIEDGMEEVVSQKLPSNYILISDPTLNQIDIMIVQIAQEELRIATSELSSMDGIEYIEKEMEVHAFGTFPNDPLLIYQYGLTTTGINKAWAAAGATSGTSTIAILDTGLDNSSGEFSGRILPGYDFVNIDSSPLDDNGHGTLVTGVAAAAGNNGSGMAGVTWNSQIIPVKVLDRDCDGVYSNIAKGIIFATDNGADVINLSLGGPQYSKVLEDAVNYAFDHGTMVVAASGNQGIDKVYYPAAYPNAIAVAAVDKNNIHAGFSNFGPEIDLVAPGVQVLSVALGGAYVYNSGTSMAAPFITGSIAYLEDVLGIDAQSAYFQIYANALDLGIAGKDQLYGAGIIQIDRVVAPNPPSPTRKITSGDWHPVLSPTAIPTITLSVTANESQFTPIITVTLSSSGSTSSPDTSINQVVISETPAIEQDTPEKKETRHLMYDQLYMSVGLILIITGIVLFFLRRRLFPHNKY